MSPVATWGTPHCRASPRAWVPLPAPGGPRKISRSALRTGGPTPSAPPEGPGPRARAPQEALVVAHEQVGLHLAHGVQGHAHDDQEAGAAEVERHVEPADEVIGQDGDH